MTAVRDATETDLPDILEITNEAIIHTTAVWTLAPTTLEARRIWLSDRQCRGFPVLVAGQNGRIAGFASYGEYRPWDGAASIPLHRSAGFQEARVLHEVGRKFGRWLDLLFMQKRLSGPHDLDD